MPNIGLALSGGGNRASVFNLGVLLYLADAGKNTDVRSIASVSGGSVTNGYVAQLGNYDRVTATKFRIGIMPLIARLGSKGTLWAWWGTWLYLAWMILNVLAIVAIAFIPWNSLPVRLLISLIAFAVVGKMGFEKRGAVCGRAFASTLYSPNGKATRLSETGSVLIDHVFCATDLHAGEHIYFSGNFICSFRFGWGTPANLPLHVAVQASAAFPGAFPPRILATGPHRFRDGKHRSRFMFLQDGGAYDNMAEQWPMGIRNRKERWPGHARDLVELDEVVVVNASTNMRWEPINRLLIPVINEVLAMKRVIDVLYDNTTTVRRRFLMSEFDIAEKSGGTPRGTLVMLEQSPFRVPSAFLRDEEHWPARAARARVALASLGDTQDSWNEIVRLNCAVPTTFRSLGNEVVARLLYQAYVTAMCNLHVILGYPLLSIPQLADFEALVTEASQTADA